VFILKSEKSSNQCKIDFIASQIRENRITYEILLRELKKELKEFQK